MPDLSDKVSELAPCPFCGNDECHLVVFDREDDSRAPRPHRVYKAYCGICEAEVERESPVWWSTNKPSETDTDLITRAKVVAAWNHRTRPPASSMEGWRVVPEEPTDEMLTAAHQHYPKAPETSRWKAMLAVSPIPPEVMK